MYLGQGDFYTYDGKKKEGAQIFIPRAEAATAEPSKRYRQLMVAGAKQAKLSQKA